MRALPDRFLLVAVWAASVALARGTAAQTAAVGGDEPEPRTAPVDSSRTEVDHRAGPFFHHGYDYGSEAYAGPLDVLLNKGFALAQVVNRSQKVFGYDYGWGAVSDAVAHPLRAIERSGGWGHLLRTEVLPVSFDPHSAAWWPNYFGHVIEGGITARRMTEWYGARGLPAPWLLSAATTMGAAVLNEAYEARGGRVGSAAKVVDLYLFDPLGIVLFSSDRVARFFARDLSARVWPGQASFAVPSGELLNTANHLVMKLPVLPLDDASLFFRTGIGTHLGVTLHRPAGLDWSLGLGSDASRHRIDPETGVESVEIAWSGALYVDRNGSLLASLAVSRLDERAVTLNVYPGVLHDALGGWVNVTGEGRVQVGLTGRSWLGMGVGGAF